LTTAKPIARLAAFATVLLLAGCAANPAIEESRSLLASGRLDEGIQRLEQARRENPDDRELRAHYFRSRDVAAGQLLAAADGVRDAGRFDEAESLYRRVLRMDAESPRAKNGLDEVAAARRHETRVEEAAALLKKNDAAGAERLLRTVLAQNPMHAGARRLMQQVQQAQAAKSEAPARSLKSPFSKPITLEFRDTPMKTVFEVISRSSGINFVFDKDVKSDAKVTIFVRNTSIEDVVRLVLVTHQLERRLLNENSVLIYPNTAAKAKEYQELVVKSFYLANADAKQALAMVKTVLKVKDAFVEEKLNLLVMKDTPELVRLAEQLIASIDLAEPEVMLELEVLEVSSNRLLELGLRFPDQVGLGLLNPTITNTTTTSSGFVAENKVLGGTLATGYVDLRNRGGLTSFIANPAVMLNLKEQDGDSNLLANPRIRVKNREKAKVHIGDKLPVFTTTSTANVGVSASVSYLDVGLKLEVEPNIFLEDEVSIKVGLEVSSIVKEVPGPASSLAYQVGTRSATTTLRLKNGETQVLAGLISNEERNSANKLPGLGDLPLVGRLFSSNKDTRNKTEIVLLLTPRIVRNLARPPAAAPALASGTDAALGAPPLVLPPTAPRSLGLSGTPSPMGGARAAVPVPPAAAETPAAPAAVPAPVAPVPPAEERKAPAAAPNPAATPTPSGGVAVPSPVVGGTPQ